MRVMTLDMGKLLGWSHGDPRSDAPPIFGTQKLPDVQLTKRMISLEKFVIEMVRSNSITDLWVEKSIIPQRTSYDAVTTLTGYGLVAGIAATKCGVNCYLIDLQTWRSELGLPTQGPKNVLADPRYKSFAGRKNGLSEAKRQYVKDAAVALISKKGLTVSDDNAADAACIYYAVKQRLERKADEVKYDLFADLTV